MQADGTVLIDTEIDTSGMKPGTKEVEAAVRRMANGIDDLGKKQKSQSRSRPPLLQN